MRPAQPEDIDGETLALLGLSFCPGIGPLSIHRLLEAFGAAERVLELSRNELTAGGVNGKVAEAVVRGPKKEDVEDELDLLVRCGTKLLGIHSRGYPEPLRRLGHDAPPLLRLRGDYLEQDRLAVALVGARNCTHYGRMQGRRFAMGLVDKGFTIISGHARGIDAECHRAALQAGGRTLAVLGCGLARLDSLNDPELALEIAESGALLSELPMEAPPLARHFPPRNRLISGLSTGVVVLEAGSRSGSLITARFAGEQGKTVFAVPGSVESAASRGCHQLIRDGAVLIESPGGVPQELGPLPSPVRMCGGEAGGADALAVEDPRETALNGREKRVLQAVEHQPLHLDELLEETELPVSLLSGALMSLEIRGLVTRLEGDRYVRGAT